MTRNCLIRIQRTLIQFDTPDVNTSLVEDRRYGTVVQSKVHIGILNTITEGCCCVYTEPVITNRSDTIIIKSNTRTTGYRSRFNSTCGQVHIEVNILSLLVKREHEVESIKFCSLKECRQSELLLFSNTRITRVKCFISTRESECTSITTGAIKRLISSQIVISIYKVLSICSSSIHLIGSNRAIRCSSEVCSPTNLRREVTGR